MPPTVHARSEAFRAEAQAHGATIRISPHRAHRRERPHPSRASPKHASCARHGGSERWKCADRPRHRPVPRRREICRPNANRRPAGPLRRSPSPPWHGTDAGSRTVSWPAWSAWPRTGCPQPNPGDVRIARCARNSWNLRSSLHGTQILQSLPLGNAVMVGQTPGDSGRGPAECSDGKLILVIVTP